MPVQSQRTRLLSLMELLEYEGVTNWRKMVPKYQDKHVFEFKQWLLENLQFLPDEPQVVIRRFYVEDEDGRKATNFYRVLDQGRAALIALYRKDSHDRTNE